MTSDWGPSPQGLRCFSPVATACSPTMPALILHAYVLRSYCRLWLPNAPPRLVLTAERPSATSIGAKGEPGRLAKDNIAQGVAVSIYNSQIRNLCGRPAAFSRRDFSRIAFRLMLEPTCSGAGPTGTGFVPRGARRAVTFFVPQRVSTFFFQTAS